MKWCYKLSKYWTRSAWMIMIIDKLALSINEYWLTVQPQLQVSVCLLPPLSSLLKTKTWSPYNKFFLEPWTLLLEIIFIKKWHLNCKWILQSFKSVRFIINYDCLGFLWFYLFIFLNTSICLPFIPFISQNRQSCLVYFTHKQFLYLYYSYCNIKLQDRRFNSNCPLLLSM